MLAACDDDADLVAQFRSQLRTIQSRIRAGQQAAKALETAIDAELEAATMAKAGRFQVETAAVEPVLVMGLRMSGRYEECGRGFKTLARAMGRHIAGKPMCLYHDGEFRDEDANFEPCFPIRREVAPGEGISVRTLPSERCLTLIHQGPYAQLGRSYKIILAECKRRGAAPALPSREIYIKGPGMIFRGNPRNYLTQIQIPIQDK
jgi:effector-binding domain-containing protein